MCKIFDTLYVLACDHDSGLRESVVAVVMCKRRVIAFGFNQHKTHPLQVQYAKNEHAIFLHAEIDAIRRAQNRGADFSKCDIYVMRVKRNGPGRSARLIPATSKPCVGCAECIKDYGLRHTYYSVENVDKFVRL